MNLLEGKSLPVKRILIGIFLGTSWGLIINSFFRIRPVQDDYLVLNAISNDSIANFLRSIWQSQGGNLFPYAINSLLLSPSAQEINFYGLIAYYFFTICAVSGAGILLLKMLLGSVFELLGKYNLFLYITLILISFEGIFVPSFAGAFSFSLASIAHLWPVILMTYVVYLLKYPGLSPMAFPIGILIGNSNAGESFTCLLIGLFLLVGAIKKRIRPRVIYLGSLSAGILIGFLIMIAAPGFSNRANNAVGLPSTSIEFIQRLLKALISFLADALTHPGSYVAFIVGVVLVRNFFPTINHKILQRNIFRLLAAFALLLASLISGGTLAYSSWHQAFGIDFLLVPVFLSCGALMGLHFPRYFLNYVSNAMILFVLATSLFSVRSAVLIHERSSSWDKSFNQNICELKEGDASRISGAELLYPPLRLGIEDIQSWEWMKVGYLGWVRGLKEYDSISCN